MMAFDIKRLIRDNVRDLKPYASARDEYVSDGSEKVFLDANENPFDNGLNRYPDPQQRSLKSILAELRKLNEDQILLGNGSDEVLDLIFRAFCEPKSDNIITVPPTYGMYKVLAGINDVENREVILNANMELEVDNILDRTDDNTKLIFICSPNNPTGNRFISSDIERLLNSFEGIVVVDEAYIDFSRGKSWIAELENHPNLLVTQTLSKAYAMAGIRLGICYGAPEIIAVLNRIKPPYNVNELTQQKASQILLDKNLVPEQVATILDEREKMSRALTAIPYIDKVFPTDANFILVRVDDALQRYNQLIDRGIVVRNRSTLPRCENTLRLTVGTPEENIKLINVLKTI